MLISQEFVRDSKFTNYDIAVWCYAFMEVQAPWKEHTLLSSAQIVDQMKGSIDVPHSYFDEIVKALRHLVESGILCGAEQVGKQYYRVYKDSFKIPDGHHYFNVEPQDIRAIFQQHSRPFAVLRYYLLTLSTIDPKTKYGYCSNETLASFFKNNTETITHYNKALEDMQLIYVYRGIYSSNTYGRYEDKNIIIAAGNKRSGSRQIKMNSNYKRRMAQMYNQLKSNPVKYDKATREEIYNYCSAHNDREQEIVRKNPKYISKFFDLSIIDLTSQS